MEITRKIFSHYFAFLLIVMEDYTINVALIEEHQTIGNVDALETIFARAKSAIVNGAKVFLVRKDAAGKAVKFGEMDTLEELEKYRKQVFKYLPHP